MGKRINFTRWIALLVVVLSVCMIYGFSSDDGGQSGEKSRWVAEQIARVRYADFKSWPEARREKVIEDWQYPVRKGAHLSEYALLGFGCGLLAAAWGKGKRGRRFFGAFLLALLVASSDEIHQIFVAGRTASPVDVGIDMIGVSIGIAVAALVGRRGRGNASAEP